MADVDTLLLGRIIYQLGSCSSFFQFWTVFWLLVCISERVFGKGGTNVACRPAFGMFADRGARLSLLGARLSLLRPRPRPRQPPLRSGAPLDPSSRRPHTGLNGSSGPAPPSCFPSPRSFAFTVAAGAPAPARPAMNLIFAMVLVAQLDGVEGVKCGRGEYPVGAECCPMCGAGLRVYKHCTASSSTTCIPCVADTYTDHPNGLERCMDCKLCDKGANLVPEVACTYTKNTVCGCPPGYFCSYFGTEDCELCQHYTVCFPDSMVKVKGTKTTDNVCEACPPGTFSTANMPYNCTSQSTRQEDGLVQGEGRNTPSAAVFIVPVLVVVALLVATASLAYIWQRRRRKSRVPPVQESGGGQQGQALILTTDSRDQTTVPVQETGDDPEETRSE